ncbi:MAG: hypothetical protein WDO18_10625 [Acidobacteriota bacterium]
MLHLKAVGVTRFVEIGPGAVLTGILRNIDAQVTGLKFGEPEDLAKLTAVGATV